MSPPKETKIYLRVEKETKAKEPSRFAVMKDAFLKSVDSTTKKIRLIKFPKLKFRFVLPGRLQKKEQLEKAEHVDAAIPLVNETMAPWQQRWHYAKRAFVRSLYELRRNILRSLATILIISLVLSTLSIALVVSFLTEAGISIINTKIDTSIEIQETATFDAVQPLIQELQVLPYITKVVYISKNQALEDFKMDHPELPDFLNTYDIANPLPATLRVSLSDPKKYSDLISFLDRKQNSQLINLAKARDNFSDRTRIEQLISITDSVKYFLYLFVTFFAAIGVLIIISTVQLSLNARKRELSIMQVVGASYQKILLPFGTEAGILSLFSTVLALIFLWTFGQRLSPFAVQYFGSDSANIVHFLQANSVAIVLMLFGVAVAITLITTWLTVWRYLKSQRLF